MVQVGLHNARNVEKCLRLKGKIMELKVQLTLTGDKMSKWIILLLIILITGCGRYSEVIELNVTGNGECLISCKNIMDENWCNSVTPSFQQTIINGKEDNNYCECILLDCFKNHPKSVESR